MSTRGHATRLLALILALSCLPPATAAPRRGKHGPSGAKPPAESSEPAAPPAAADPASPAAPADKPAAPADQPAAPADKPAAPADKPAAPADKPASPADKPPSTAAKPAAPGAPQAPAKPAVKEKKLRKIRVTILPVLEKNFPERSAVALQRELSEGLRRNNRLDMKDLDVRLAEFAQEMPFEQVELARNAYTAGLESLHNLNLDTAVTQMADAVDQLIAVLPYIKKQELADAMLALAVTQQQKGNTRAMQVTLKRLLVWRSTYQLDTTVFPQQINDPLEEARTAVGQLAQGQIKVLSEPPGSQVFVDGDFAGVSPVVVSNLTVGEHFVTYKKLGYKRGLRVANVTGGAPLQVLDKLARAEKYLLVEQALDRVGPKVGKGPLDPVIDNLRETLFLDHAVFLRLQKAGPMSSNTEEVAISAYLYDLRSHTMLKQSTDKVKVANGVPPDGAMQRMAELLYQDIDYDNELRAPEDAPPVVIPPKPLYKRWWFWTALGVIVAGGASAIAVGLLSRPPTCPDGHVCTGELIYSLRLGF